jgi:hypothetical protein
MNNSLKLDYYVYAVIFAFCLVKSVQLWIRGKQEDAAGYILATLWTFYALYVSTFWEFIKG